jgi:GNAT superfamily N-acetyltransferase
VNSDGVALRLAMPDDLQAIGELRRQAGWHVYRWALLDAMRPPHARCFVATEPESARIVAVGSGIAYGRLGIVGNMVVDAAHRGRGLGRRILAEVCDFLERERGCTQLELHTTDDGRRLYRHYGFEPAGSQVRATLPRADVPDGPAGYAVGEAGPTDLPALAAWDGERFGGDRTPVLETAIADPERAVRIARRGAGIAGYAVLRPDGRIGPWLADDVNAAASLLAHLGRAEPATESFVTGMPGENAAGRAWLEGLGARMESHDGRMRRGSGVARRLETVYGNVIGALG